MNNTSPIVISVVSPVYKAENIVKELVERLSRELIKISPDFEIILVEDGSPDNSWEAIADVCKTNKKVKGIKLSRNFGQHNAVSAGIKEANGSCIVLMDCDLQDDPAEIISLYREFQNGYDVVFTKRKKRKHSFFKAFTGWLYNLLFHVFSDADYDVNVGSLLLISRKVKMEFDKLQDKERIYTQLIKWLGFKTTYLTVEHKERFSGKSSYSLTGLFKLAIQGWTSHSDKLLRLSIYGGFILSALTFIIGIIVILKYFFQGFQPGWPSLFLAILFSTGLILISIGIAGLYIGKIFEQSKNKPIFVIDQKLNL
jgi:polyisoprenyl-phosphate glycosyltransferase